MFSDPIYIGRRRFRHHHVLIWVLVILAVVYLCHSPEHVADVDVSNYKPQAPRRARRPAEAVPRRPIGRGVCPDYTEYAGVRHGPLSTGPLQLPLMRPPAHCRTFTLRVVDKAVADLSAAIADPDLARLVENTLPNTLDTTILFHEPHAPATFVVTGDIHAEWLRDAARQLSVYQRYARADPALATLIRGAIATQAGMVVAAPYCNAFHPPAGLGVRPVPLHRDNVRPAPDWRVVYECKWEIDLLASFLGLANEYYDATGDTLFVDEEWLQAFYTVLSVVHRQRAPTFAEDGSVNPFPYTFQRETHLGLETLLLGGTGNPVRGGGGMVRLAFRPLDDACIFQFFIPGNAQLSVELNRTAVMLRDWAGPAAPGKERELLEEAIGYAETTSAEIRAGIMAHGVVKHPVFGQVFAYEVDGYGGVVSMDDANLPLLLALPDMGFVSVDDPVYQNTRRMVLLPQGNAYYVHGERLEGIGGPHVGIHHAWPMLLCVRIRTSTDDAEIREQLAMLKRLTGGLGLMHESVNVHAPSGKQYTRPWFAWCNSEFGKTILDLAERKPHILKDRA